VKTDISGEIVASIFRVEKSASEEQGRQYEKHYVRRGREK
jgi:hypothetical protein